MKFEIIEKADLLQIKVFSQLKVLPLVIILALNIGVLLFMVYAVYYFLFINYDLVQLFLSIGILFLVFISIFSGLYWFLWGYEFLEIKGNKVVTYVQALYKINIKRFEVKDIFDVRICTKEVDPRTSNSESAYFYGYDRGKICILTFKYALKFGSSLTDEEAKTILAVIKRKLNELRKG